MAAQPLIQMYDSYRNAAQTVKELEAAGVLRCDISILTSHFVDRGTNGMTPDRLELTAIGGRSRAGARYPAGPAIGAGTKPQSELAAFTIPDIGAVVAAGWLASSAAVLGAGYAPRGLMGALTASGLNECDARLYANGARRGATLVAVRSDYEHHASTETILQRHSPIDCEALDIGRNEGGADELPGSGQRAAIKQMDTFAGATRPASRT